MARISSALWVSLFMLIVGNVDAQINLNNASNEQIVMTNISSMPLSFTENHGQWDEKVLFRAEAGGATFYFCIDEVAYLFVRDTDELLEEEAESFPDIPDMFQRFERPRYKKEALFIKAQFIGANPNPEMIGIDPLPHNNNYFYGNDASKWRTDVPNYSSITYKDIYPGIDLKYHGNGQGMKYDFIINPGADISQIQIRYDGADDLRVTPAGDLQAQTRFGLIHEKAPYIYQQAGGAKREVAGYYDIKEPGVFGFIVGDDYNISFPLIIDPELVYSTYLGGNVRDAGCDIMVDDSGNAYVTGYTWSVDFPTVDPYQTDQPSNDVFVTKLAPGGDSLIYSTYLGGSNWEMGFGIAVDASGNAYVTGTVNSTDFPTVNPYQTDQPSEDVFVTKLAPNGSALLYSTYLGGNDDDRGRAIAVDGNGNAYVIGATYSTDFPVENPYQIDQPGTDVFVTKLAPNGSALAYSTYLGGNGTDWGFDITVNGSGNAYVTGYTWSVDFPTVDPYQTDQPYNDIFVTKLSPNGSALVYSTYLGGNYFERGHGMVVDVSGNAYITGWTGSSDFPVENPFDNSLNGDNDVFITKLSSSGNTLSYSTYLGGSDNDGGSSIAVDASGNAYVTGSTESSDFPTENPYQTDQPYRDVFITKLSASGNTLSYSTYLGGSDNDEGIGIAVDASGNAYVTGSTSSTNFPTVSPYQTDQPSDDAFVAKLGDNGGGPDFLFLKGIVFSKSNYNALSDVIDIVVLFENQSENPVTNIAVEAYIDEELIPLELGDRDLDGDLKIDVIEAGWDTLMIASFQLPSNNWENHSLRIEVTEVEGQPVDQEIEKTISCYFAQKIENSLPDPFDLREDAYSFPNPPTRFSDLGELLFSYCSLFPTELVNYIYGLIGGRNGRCYGMASTCYWYFQEPSRKPQSGEVFEWELGDEGVLNNINDYFLNQMFDESPVNYQAPNQVEPECRNYLTAGQPVVIQMGGGTTSHPVFHAVNAYRIIADETGDSTYLFIYENNFPSEVDDPDSRNAVIGLIDVQQNEFMYPIETLGEGENALQAGYYSRLVASSPPNTIMSGCDMVRDAFDFLQETISEFWDFGKSILNIRCPVRGYVENEFGQRSGYLSENEFVNEIPDAEVLSIFNNIGDSLLAFYLPLDGQYTLHLFALYEGVSNISLIYPNSDSCGTLASLENIPFSQQSLATFYFDSDGFGDLEMDIEGDGTPDIDYPPVDNIPPAFFDLINPLDEQVEEGDVLFEWESSYDLDEEDTFFYRLYVSLDEQFLEADSVDVATDTTFLWTEELPQGTIFWRVKAIDSRGSETTCLRDYGMFYLGGYCLYTPGDCNHNGTPLELGDVIAMIGMYRGSVLPPYECPCPPHGDNFTPTADPNGNCVAFELGDVVTEIAAYRGTGEASGCADCPGQGR